MKSKLLILSTLLGLSIIASGCTNTILNGNTNNTGNIDSTSGEIVGMANPASVYCEENGGTLELIFDNGESYRMCHFKNGEVCEEREFFRKECFPASEKNIDTETQKKDNEVMCTMDAKMCPDGSYVTRIGPDCKFKECTITKNTGNNNEEVYEEETITDILENHANISGYQKEGLTEEDIDLMEAIIEKLK